jgi:hypothetical protein
MADLDECINSLEAITDTYMSMSFDDLLALYLKINRLRAIPLTDQFDLRGLSSEKNSALPYQARMFRQWTRLSGSIIKKAKLAYKDELYKLFGRTGIIYPGWEKHFKDSN